MENVKSVFVQMTERPSRKVIIKRGVDAEEYFQYCSEVGCDVWGILSSIKSISGEPVCLWLPDSLRTPGTSKYVQGVEVAADYQEPVPEGFACIELPAAKYLMFRGEPFAEENYCQAITEVQQAIENMIPLSSAAAGIRRIRAYSWNLVGRRGYIELLPVKEI